MLPYILGNQVIELGKAAAKTWLAQQCAVPGYAIVPPRADKASKIYSVSAPVSAWSPNWGSLRINQ